MRFLSLVVLVLIFAGALSLPAEEMRYPVGEKLEYRAYALGFIPIGDVWVDISTGVYNGVPTYQFNGRCLGDYKIYVADVRLTSHIDAQSDRSVYHYIEQYGSERRGRRLLFDWNKNQVDYIRREKDGSYAFRRSTPVTPDVFDVFASGLQARHHFSTDIGTTNDVKLIEKDRVYHLKCTAVEEKYIDIPEVGVFKAARVTFQAVNLSKDEIFKGLLDLDKDIELWIDTSTKTPLVFITSVPFGFVRPKVSVVLKKWHTIPGFEPVLYSRDVIKAQAKK